MDLTIEQSSLARALRAVGRIVPTRAILPVLQAAVLAARDGRLTLRATDIELAMTTSIAAGVAVPGETALPARLLAEYVAQLPTGPVRLTLEPERSRVRVTAGRFVARVATLDPSEFPAFSAVADDRAIDLDATTFRAALGRVTFAAARDESRPVLAAVLFAFGADGLTFAAADGFRLARIHRRDWLQPSNGSWSRPGPSPSSSGSWRAPRVSASCPQQMAGAWPCGLARRRFIHGSSRGPIRMSSG